MMVAVEGGAVDLGLQVGAIVLLLAGGHRRLLSPGSCRGDVDDRSGSDVGLAQIEPAPRFPVPAWHELKRDSRRQRFIDVTVRVQLGTTHRCDRRSNWDKCIGDYL